jgi:hypothetical protein
VLAVGVSPFDRFIKIVETSRIIIVASKSKLPPADKDRPIRRYASPLRRITWLFFQGSSP